MRAINHANCVPAYTASAGATCDMHRINCTLFVRLTFTSKKTLRAINVFFLINMNIF